MWSTIHPYTSCSKISDMISPFTLPFPWGFHNKLQAQAWKWHKRGRKIKYWRSIGKECVLKRSSAVHFEYILLIERITVAVVARLGVGGIQTSKQLLSLQAMFNWTLIQHLPGLSSFWSWRSWQWHICLKSHGRLVSCTCALLQSIQLTGRQKDVLLLCSSHARLISTTAEYHHATPSRGIDSWIESRPGKMKCHD